MAFIWNTCIENTTLKKSPWRKIGHSIVLMDHLRRSCIEDVELGKVGLVRFCLVFRRNGFLRSFYHRTFLFHGMEKFLYQNLSGIKLILDLAICSQ